MGTLADRLRIVLPILGLVAFGGYTSTRLVQAHLDKSDDHEIGYDFERELNAARGSVFDVRGRTLARFVPIWEYRLDPVALTNRVVRPGRKLPPRTKEEIVVTIADALNIDRKKVAEMAENVRSRYQLLGLSADVDANKILADRRFVSGVIIGDAQTRQYPGRRSLCHVLGAVNHQFVGVAGVEQRCEKWLRGMPGRIRGKKDALGRELYDRREISIDPRPGADVYLTIDEAIQHEAEKELAAGVEEFGAGSGWCVVMDVKTGAVLAMASCPDFDPSLYGRADERARLNRAVAFTYEPGSVMKVIAAATAIELGMVRPDSLYTTNRDDERYYRLPGDAGHVWEPRMTLTDAIVHSSNIVIGKLGCDLGPRRLYEGMRRFGFGEKTGIELPGEEVGILIDPSRRMWDKATWSRAAIGQAFTVTAIQLVSAYQAIANDGVRMRPYIIDRVVAADGTVMLKNEPREVRRVISAETARQIRDMMRGVASPNGTARRAALGGYSVAGKTGTAQKSAGRKGYLPGLFRASFCGMVPASDPEVVILVTLDFDEKRKFHQGGNSSGPVFRRIAAKTLRYLMVPKDLPDYDDDIFEEDEYDLIPQAPESEEEPPADPVVYPVLGPAAEPASESAVGRRAFEI